MRDRTLALIAALVFVAASADAQVATFSAIDDASPGVCYDPATTAPDALNPNILHIGVHSGFSSTSWTNIGCIASTTSFHSRLMNDTIAARIEAPAGFYISRVTFTQTGSATSSRVGQVFAGAQWVVDGDALPGSLSGGTIDLTGQFRTVVPVSFSIFLGAKINGTSGSASASVANPALVVELLPLPAACANGIDDDGDGFVDFGADSGCGSASDTLENPECDDQLDNDGDSLFDTLDSDCSSPSDATERASSASASGSCGVGPELAALMPVLGRLRRRFLA